MSTENMFAVLQGEQSNDVTQPIAHGDQGALWVARVAADDPAAPLPPPPMPEAAAPADVIAPPPPPAMPEVATPVADTTVTDTTTPVPAPPPPAMPDPNATTMAAPAEKSTGGWEVDSYRLRAFGDAVVRARSYLDAVRMKVDRMQGSELSPQLGTSPVGQQLAKKFDDRLNADNGLRAMLTEAMKRMERFVSTAEEASRAYEQAEETATEDLDKFKYEVDWWDEESADQGHGHGHGEYHHDHDEDDQDEDQDAEGQGPGEEQSQDEPEDKPEDEADDMAEDGPGDQQEKPEDKGEWPQDNADDVDDRADDQPGDRAEDEPGEQSEDRAEQPQDRADDKPGDQTDDQQGERSDDRSRDDRPGRGRGEPD